jgi:hypothetical protein
MFNIATATKKSIVAQLAAFTIAHNPKGKVEELRTLLQHNWPATPEHNCPHCSIQLDNGLLHVDDTAANTDVTYREQRDPSFAAGAHMCMGCGGHFGEPVVYATVTTGLKIEKDRPEQNGVKRPSVGGLCRAVWDALDAYLTETGDQPTAKVVRDLAADEGWNPNNASIEFYQWRKYHGIKGRTPKVEAPAD